ncbi:MAG: hypothetical protein QM770_09945 [Tepidisphaeraceae bacterium]
MSNASEAKRSVSCPNCAKKLMAPESYVGKKLKCPQCAKVFVCDFGVSTIESGMDRARAAASAAPPAGGFKRIDIPEEKVDPKREAMLFFLGAGACILTTAIFAVLWDRVSVMTGNFVPALGFVAAIPAGLSMLAVTRKPGDVSNAAMSACLFVATLCVTFWCLWGGGPDFSSKPKVADERDALAALMTVDKTAGLDTTKPVDADKIRTIRAEARQSIESLKDDELRAKFENLFDVQRRVDVVECVARRMAWQEGIDKTKLYQLQANTELWTKAQSKAQLMTAEQVRETLAKENSDIYAKSYFEMHFVQLAAKEGIDPKLHTTRRNELYDQAKADTALMSGAELDYALRKNGAIEAASESVVKRSAKSRMPFEPDRWMALILVASGLLAGASAYGWRPGD